MTLGQIEAELAQLLGWIRKPREGDAEDLI